MTVNIAMQTIHENSREVLGKLTSVSEVTPFWTCVLSSFFFKTNHESTIIED